MLRSGSRPSASAGDGRRGFALGRLAVLAVGAASVLVLALACRVDPPVRVVTPGPTLYQEIRDSVGSDRLFRLREGVTLSGMRVYPDEAAAPPHSRPVSLSLKPTGAFLLSLGTAESSMAWGFDGREAWTLDPRGVAHAVGLGTRAHQLVDGWLRTMLWLTPGDDRFEVAPKTSDEEGVELLNLKRVGDPVEVLLRADAITKRPLSFEWIRNGRTRTVRFADWRNEEGVWLPHEMSESIDGALLHTDRYERRTLGTPRDMGAPRSRPSDTSFAVGTGAVDTRVDKGGRFYISTSVDDAPELWMLVDSGFGSHAIDPEAAASLDVTGGESASLVGVSGKGGARWAAATELRVGRLIQTSPRFVTVDTQFLSVRAGFEVAGILGSPLFERAIVTLDEPRGRVSVDDPRTFERRGLEWLPLQLDGSAPCVSGTLVLENESTPPLWLRLDTGSDDTLTVARWAAKAHDLVGDRTLLRATRIEGVFGAIPGWRRRMDRLDLGDPQDPALRILQPEVTLLRDGATGPLSDPWIAGNLGTRSLRGCRVTFDFPGERVSIRPQ
ncbi:MAG: hypothetical protein AAGG01_04745 [Planctomycetota bacterium]